ncbi:MAG: arsenosugar biosynthesis radical SAM protein ArsS [Deltaproteobacteria bacterium]|nr:arsenosugar biosynthesis radical SAM protein ArsS [Deltaproteobacteria bacterium]
MYSEQSQQATEADLGKESVTIDPFRQTLAKHGLTLERDQTTTLQVNVGLLCNQTCLHCHLSAGPGRKENMNSQTLDQIVDYAGRSSFEIIDITGGAPELNHNIVNLIERLSPLAPRIMIRSNLSALNDGRREHLFELFKEHRVVVVASFPSLNEAQTESQRGHGIFSISISALKKLNALGYGEDGSRLELNLVSNPTGAFLPSSQPETERRFRQVLLKKWGIIFNNLFTFANVPLGRFRDWLLKSGNLENYIEKLASSFNPCAVEGVMCRTMVSVSWDGYLYDCDFNLARDLFLGGRKKHISGMTGPPEPGNPIAVAEHCFSCTAGAGFT